MVQMTVEIPIRYKISWNDHENGNIIFLNIDAYDLQNLAHILTQNKIDNFHVEVIDNA